MPRRRVLPTAAAMLLTLLLATAAARSAETPAARAAADPAAYFDAPDPTTSLDLFGARFGQASGADLTLVLRTHEPISREELKPSPTSGLCVWLRTEQAPAPAARICIVPRSEAKSGLGLRYVALDRAGNRVGIRDLPAVVRRPQSTLISTRFSPASARLAPGRYHWQVRSQAGGVEDRLPNAGELPLEIAISTAPEAHARCFGAAARDPLRKCLNPKLRDAVVPTPDEAVISQNAACTPLPREGLVSPCEFGVPALDASGSIALVGDSHASHWRAALDQVSRRKRWRGISITRSGCPLTRAAPTLEPASRYIDCTRWNQQVPAWFARHPEVHTVFVVGHFAEAVLVRDGKDAFAAKVRGYIDAWKALPATVKRIVVIRDTPLIGHDAFECVRRAHARRRDAGKLCAVPRGGALRADAAVVAAGRLRSPRVRTVDMTPFFCGPRRCYPVVGGALVYKDDQHITEVFGASLGPYLLRAIDKL